MLRMALAGLTLAVCAMAAAPTKCTGYPVQWTVNNTYIDVVTPSLVVNDGKGAYLNGTDGVSLSFSTCGSGDAILALSGATRSVSFQFTQPLYTNQYTPAGFSGSTVKTDSVNVRNVFYNYNSTGDYTFTTRLGVNMINIGPFRMVNLGSQAVSPPAGNDDVANSPYADALVDVHHCPKSTFASGGCPALAHETWFVYPDQTTPGSGPSPTGFAPTGTLLLSEGSGKNAKVVNAGEFAMPFYFAISLLN